MKPDYYVPTMREVAKVRGTNGYKVVSTFSGCGGACLGFEMAGFDVVWANEFVPEAQETYRRNHPDTFLDTRDIRTVQAQDILDQTGLAIGELDVFEGSPPCASFSTSGKREKGWGTEKKYSDTVQRADDLFFEYARLLRGLQPKTFTAENVSGLVKGKAIGYFKLILTELRSAGYHVEAKLLNAASLGVPQARQRIIFVGVRNDLWDAGVRVAHPKPFPYEYSLAEVLPSAGIPRTAGGFFTTPAVDAQEVILDPETGQAISLNHRALGAAWDRTPIGKGDVKYINFNKPHPNKPVPTITVQGGIIGAASVVHPTERRKFNLEELRLLSSFPSDFVLTGKYPQRYERIGRSVPPLMAKAIAEAIRDEMLAKIPR